MKDKFNNIKNKVSSYGIGQKIQAQYKEQATKIIEFAHETAGYVKENTENKSFIKHLFSRKVENFMNFPQWKMEAKAHIKDIASQRHAPMRDSIPEDLRDVRGNFIVTKDGYPVASKVLPIDMGIGSDSPAAPIYIGMFALAFGLYMILNAIGLQAVGIALMAIYLVGMYVVFGGLTTFFYTFLTFGLGTAVTLLTSTSMGSILAQSVSLNTVALVGNMIPALFPFIYFYWQRKTRAKKLMRQIYQEVPDTNFPQTHQNKSRYIQAENAEKDNSHFTTYGYATGSFYNFGDELAPDIDLPVGQTTKDQSTNLLIFGAIGTGKTTNLRQIFLGQIEAEKNGEKRGICVFDGKAVLAKDFQKYLDVLVSTSTVKNFNFIDGLPPEVLARVFENQFAPKKSQSGNSSFFTSSARSIIFYSAVIKDALVSINKGSKSFMSLYTISGQMMEQPDEDGNHPLIKELQDHPEFGQEGTLVNDAIQEIIKLSQQPAETKQNIFATVKSWLLPFIQAKELRAWASCEESDFDFSKVKYGAKIGFVLPESTLGAAGPVISALMKARLFNMIASRAIYGERWKEEGETPICLFVDEAQNIMDDGDLDALPKGRSLGLVCFYATQNIDNFINQFGQEGCKPIIESFRSFICLKSSHATYEYLANKIGKARTMYPTKNNNAIAFSQTLDNTMNDPLFDPNNDMRHWLKAKAMNELQYDYGTSTEQGSKWFTAFGKVGGGSSGKKTQISHYSVSKESEPILKDMHLTMLNEPFTAICIVNRAGVERRDIIKTIPLNDNFEPIIQHHKNVNPKGFIEEEKKVELELFGE